MQVAVGIALVEGLVVGFFAGGARWAVVALAAASVALYVSHGRNARRQGAHDTLWILACSQVLAVIIVVLAFFFSWIAYAVAAALAVAVLVLLIVER